MDIIINKAKLDNHLIDKYQFKVLTNKNIQISKPKNSLEKSEIKEQNISHEMIINTNSKDELVESLLKKTDEMTSNFIKLQMKLEQKDEECKNQLQSVKKEAYDNGMIAGKDELEATLKQNNDDIQERFISSIKKLEKNANEYNLALQKIKKELIDAALDISREVVVVQIDENSSKVAKTLADELINQLQNASKITIKVNPMDYNVLLEHLDSLQKVEIVSDNAISRGGVVAISDVGNLDAQILNRFERVKKVALHED